MRPLERIALVAVSRPASELALRLQCRLSQAEIYLPVRFVSVAGAGAIAWSGSLRDLLRRLFAEYDGLVLFGSVGMAVRLVGPLAEDKRTDPAVVVVDDAGRFVVSVLSGHLGGANALARYVARLLGAQPIITTTSDVLDTLAVDLLGRELGWSIESAENVTRVSAAMINGEGVGLLQEAGEHGWWPVDKPFPLNLIRFSTLEDLLASGCPAALVITDRVVSEWEERLPPSIIYRPRSLVVGVGCNRGTSAGEVAGAVKLGLESHGLALQCVRNLATVDLKREEAGLGEFAAGLGVPVEYFSAEDLKRVAGVTGRSAIVHRWVGTHGVCEPAALLSSRAQALLVPKLKVGNVTVAVARVDFSGT